MGLTDKDTQLIEAIERVLDRYQLDPHNIREKIEDLYNRTGELRSRIDRAEERERANPSHKPPCDESRTLINETKERLLESRQIIDQLSRDLDSVIDMRKNLGIFDARRFVTSVLASLTVAAIIAIIVALFVAHDAGYRPGSPPPTKGPP